MSTRFEPGAPAPAGSVSLCVPELRGNEWRYMKECLDTNFVSSVGPFVDRFERAIADYLGAKHAVATVNGTAALHVALLIAGVEPDDEVLVSALTFIAPANAVRYANAWPVFIDAEPGHWQMDPQRVVDFLDRQCAWQGGVLRNRVTGRRVRAILPVHILGHPVDTDPILEAVRKFDLPVIEDATESLGASYRGRRVGRLSQIACLSFNGNKLLTTGGGGMIVTDDDALAARAKYLTKQAKDDSLEFVHHAVGFNYRLTNVQAAMGVAQLECIEDFLAAKKRIAARYTDALGRVPGLTPMRQAAWASSAWWLFTVLVDADEFGMDSRSLIRRLSAAGIEARPLWQPMSQSLAHRAAAPAPCPVAEGINRVAVSLPSSVGLTADDQARVIAAIRSARPE